MKKFGPTIREIRKSKGFTLSETAKGIVSLPFLSKFERGESEISAANFLKLLDKLNINMDEFLLIENNFSENEQQIFLQKIRAALFANDIYILKSTYNEQLNRFSKTENVRHKHNMYLIDFYICHIEKKKQNEKYINEIKEYLLNIDNWGYYELTLYGNSLFVFPISLIILLSKTAYSKGTIYSKISVLHNELALILLNTITTMIDNKCFDQINDFMEKTSSLLEHTEWLYEKNKLNFLRGIIMINEGYREDGVRTCERSIQIFYDLNLNEVGKAHQEYFQKQLNSSI